MTILPSVDHGSLLPFDPGCVSWFEVRTGVVVAIFPHFRQHFPSYLPSEPYKIVLTCYLSIDRPKCPNIITRTLATLLPNQLPMVQAMGSHTG